MNLKTIDLCAGIGGIRRGFELAGEYRNIASAEIDEMACRTYEHLFHENSRNDVTSEEFKKHLQTLRYDVLLAGFPCQAFSSVGLQQGFEDKTKGTIFFDIAKIIKMTRPKVVFLENVQNLLSHDKQATFKTIVDTLDRQLDYHIVGVTHDEKGETQYERSAFLRNSRDFGVPQNRPRVYIVAFSRAYFGQHISILPKEAPCKRSRTPVFENLKDVLDEKVDPRFFLSSGYLETLEKHIVTQHDKGYGFGYCIVNAPEIKNPIANTLLATGGSGRERNLIYDPINGASCAGASVKGKYSPINDKYIRTMTPNEWGRLQGFIGYAFVDENGADQFSFPEGIPNVQKFIAGFACKTCNTVKPDYGELKSKLEDYYISGSFPYKHVIIDEGQDFGSEAIEETDIIQLIHDIIVDAGQGGTFYVFYDRLQLIQAREMPKFIGDLDCRLTLYRNCRNTENIAVTSLRPITERKPKVFEGAVKGAPAKIHFCDSAQNERERIDSIIDDLAADGYRDIVLLTCKTEATSILSDSVNNGKYRNKYLFTTCRKFKGLEADVVILLDVDKNTFDQENVLLFYVGTSRARTKLEITAILSDDECKEILLSVLNYQGKVRRAKKDFAGALNAIGSLDT